MILSTRFNEELITISRDNQQHRELLPSCLFCCSMVFLGSFFSIGNPICFFNTVLASVSKASMMLSELKADTSKYWKPLLDASLSYSYHNHKPRRRSPVVFKPDRICSQQPLALRFSLRISLPPPARTSRHRSSLSQSHRTPT